MARRASSSFGTSRHDAASTDLQSMDAGRLAARLAAAAAVEEEEAAARRRWLPISEALWL